MPEFCLRNKISSALFFKLAREGRGPRVMHVGRRTLITKESAAAWRRGLCPRDSRGRVKTHDPTQGEPGPGMLCACRLAPQLTSKQIGRPAHIRKRKTALLTFAFVSPLSPPRPRRLEVRIGAADQRAPYGRSRSFRLTHDDLDELINAATRLEARGKKS